ncbi:hypothetical protein VTI74DRAFT_9145 [Chaetomium olivicolor]
MSSSQERREETTPILVKLFLRTGAFHWPQEFENHALPKPYMDVHTWTDCTLTELAHHILDASPGIIPDPAVGTRIVFRLMYADTRAIPTRFMSKDLGSVVLGKGGPGAGPDEGVPDDEPDDGMKTLADARFIPGDYISCAILTPNELTGDVMPASAARVGRGTGVGAKASVGGPPPAVPSGRQRDYPPPRGFRGGGFRGGGQPRGYGGGRYRDRDEPFARGGGPIPDGEWRRGDRLPDEGPELGRWGR